MNVEKADSQLTAQLLFNKSVVVRVIRERSTADCLLNQGCSPELKIENALWGLLLHFSQIELKLTL